MLHIPHLVCKCLWDLLVHCFLYCRTFSHTHTIKNWLPSLPSQPEPCMVWGEDEPWYSHIAAPHEPSHWQTDRDNTQVQEKSHIRKYADINILAQPHNRQMFLHCQAEKLSYVCILKWPTYTSTLVCQLQQALEIWGIIIVILPCPVTTFHEYALHTCSIQTPASLALTR